MVTDVDKKMLGNNAKVNLKFASTANDNAVEKEAAANLRKARRIAEDPEASEEVKQAYEAYRAKYHAIDQTYHVRLKNLQERKRKTKMKNPGYKAARRELMAQMEDSHTENFEKFMKVAEAGKKSTASNS